MASIPSRCREHLWTLLPRGCLAVSDKRRNARGARLTRRPFIRLSISTQDKYLGSRCTASAREQSRSTHSQPHFTCIPRRPSVMSHRRTYTHSQHSYVVSIDAGSFANIEIVVGGYHRGGSWSPPPPRASTATTRENHGHDYGASAFHAVFRSAPRRLTTTLPPARVFYPTSHSRKKIISTTIAHPPLSPSAKHSPFVHLQSRLPPVTSTARSSSSTTTDARSKRAFEREQQKQQRVAEERRREEARRAEARRIAAEEARRRQQEESLREERRRRRRAREIASAWRTYEARWALLSQRQPELGLLSALTFERIPWPVVDAPLDCGTRLDVLLRHEAIREFLLSSAHSPDVSAKDRIRAALRRWHPDKFARVLSQVIESDRDAVAEGMGVVVRCLNDMLERENNL